MTTQNTTPHPFDYTAALGRLLGMDEYAYLLAILPDGFYDLDRHGQDKLYEQMYRMAYQRETTDNIAAEVGKALKLAEDVKAGRVTLTVEQSAHRGAAIAREIGIPVEQE